ncbi:MAG: hypothetical protein ACKVWV_16240 [Planctomycetota bacterium]
MAIVAALGAAAPKATVPTATALESEPARSGWGCEGLGMVSCYRCCYTQGNEVYGACIQSGYPSSFCLDERMSAVRECKSAACKVKPNTPFGH